MREHGSQRIDVVYLTKVPIDIPHDGGTLRSTHHVKALRARGLNVRLLAARAPLPAGVLTPRVGLVALVLLVRVGVRVLRWRSAMLARWLSVPLLIQLARLRVDGVRVGVVVIEHTHLALFRGLLPAGEILSLQNVEAELLRNFAASARRPHERLAAAYEARAFARFENHVVERARYVACVSGHDKELLERRTGPRAEVVVAPNGVTDSAFEAEEQREAVVVFVAHLGWRPNVDAARWLVTKVWPLVDARVPARLELVGRSPARSVLALAGGSVRVVPDVESVLPYVARARVATAPLLSAGGTRLKILEALACGTPVVATSLGALGLESISEPALTVRDDPAAFADALVAGLGRDEVPVGACRAAAEPYRWSATTEQIANDIARIARRERA